MPQLLVHFHRTYAIDLLDLTQEYTNPSTKNTQYNNNNNNDNDLLIPNKNEHELQINFNFLSPELLYSCLYNLSTPIPPHTLFLSYRLCQLLYAEKGLQLPITYSSLFIQYFLHHQQQFQTKINTDTPLIYHLLQQLPYQFHYQLPNGKYLPTLSTLLPSSTCISSLRILLSHTLLGGKGGFGANLKSSGKQQLAKQTTDFSLCRDLSGRRLRNINNEIRLKKWLSNTEQERRTKEGSLYEEAKGESGLKGWFLPIPTWVDHLPSATTNANNIHNQLQQKQRMLKKKTILCRNWIDARGPSKVVPTNASSSYGCVRGNHCEYAHGNEEVLKYQQLLAEEMNSQGMNTDNSSTNLSSKTIEKDKYFTELQKQADSYTKNMYMYDDNDNNNDDHNNNRMLASISQGLGHKRTLETIDNSNNKNKRTKEDTENKNVDSEEDDDNDNHDWSILTFTDKLKAGNSKNTQKWTTIVNEEIHHPTTTTTTTIIPTSITPFVPPSIYEPNQWIYTSNDTAVDIEYISSTDDSSSTDASLVRVTGNDLFSTIAIGSCIVPPKSISIIDTQSLPLIYTYEIEILTCSGIIQIGWANKRYFQPNDAQNEGVGDDIHSYSYDGLRGLKWHRKNSNNTTTSKTTTNDDDDNNSSPYGPQYQIGDIITCYIIFETITNPSSTYKYQASIGYSINGNDAGIAFLVPLSSSLSDIEFIPGISLDNDESICINIGYNKLMYNYTLQYLNKDSKEIIPIHGIPLYTIRNIDTKIVPETTIISKPSTKEVVELSSSQSTVTDTKLVASSTTTESPPSVLAPLINKYIEELLTNQKNFTTLSLSTIFEQSMFSNSQTFLTQYTVSLEEIKTILNDYGIKASGTLNERIERLCLFLQNLTLLTKDFILSKSNSSSSSSSSNSITSTKLVEILLDCIIPKNLRNNTYPTEKSKELIIKFTSNLS